MADQNKTKEQLIRELVEARRRITVLEAERTRFGRSVETLRENEALSQAIMDMTPAVIFVKDTRGRYQMVNRRYLEVTHFAREAVIGRTDHDLYPRDFAKFVTKNDHEVLKKKKPVSFEQAVVLDGEPHTFLAAKFPMCDENGRIYAICGISTDITERKLAEEALRESEAKNRALLSAIPDMMFRLGADGTYLEFIPGSGVEPLVPPEDFLGKNVRTVIPAELAEQIMRDIKEILETGTVQTHEYNLPSDNGVRSYEYRLVPCGKDEVLCIVRDITERLRAEEALRESEERCRALSEASFEGVLIHDNGEVLNVNTRFAEMYGYEIDELIGTNAFKLIAPEQLDIVKRNIASGFEGPYETLGLRKDSSTFPTEIQARPMQYHGRKVRVAVARDITEQRRAEEALRESEERFRNLVETSEDLIWRCDKEGCFIYLNPAWEKTLGYKLEEMLDHKYSEFKPEELVEKDDQTRRAILRGVATTGYETIYFSKSGKKVHLRFNAVPLVDSKGNTTGTQGTAFDITDRKQAEEERQLLATAVEQAAEAIVITDSQGKIQYVNPAFEQITGYSSEDAIGQTPRILKSGKQDDEHYRKLWTTIASGRTWAGRFINKKKDGRFFEEEITISPVRDSTGKIVNFVGVKRDITERVELEKQLRHGQKMEALGQLAGGVAHDFNNLLQVIRGYTMLVLGELEPKDPNRENIAEVARASKRGAALVRQLLAFSRRETLELEHLNLNEIIGGLKKMLVRLIGEHIELHVIVRPDVGVVCADPGQVEQVLMNLCVNARDAMPEEGGRITIETDNVYLDSDYGASHAWAKEGQFSLITVSDTGTGMPPEVRDRIFEPFFTTKRVGEGTGLGLATVYGIVKQHGGMISVYSELGRGTTFRIYLPTVEHDGAMPEEKAVDTELGGSETILLAEDEEQVRRLATRVLEKAGYRVLVAGDGEEAIALFQKHGDVIDLALLDVVMPKKSGRAVCEVIRSSRSDLPVLFSSGYSRDYLGPEFELKKSTDLILKPISPNDLLRKVKQLMEVHKKG